MPGPSKQALGGAVALAAERTLFKEVSQGPIPHHLAIIMDGNRRFAESLGLSPRKGHELGKDTLENVLEWCLDLKVRVLTVYGFSTENFQRSVDEVHDLMDLFARNFRKVGDDERVHTHKIRVHAIGRTDLLPQEVRDAIAYAEERTKDYDQYHFNIAVAYGGREELTEAVRAIAQGVAEGRFEPQDIDQALIGKHLYTAPFPDPDLVLRTSGEVRVSNFLLWQLAYSELYFADVFWPGFRKIDFLRAIRDYQRRIRRFGE